MRACCSSTLFPKQQCNINAQSESESECKSECWLWLSDWSASSVWSAAWLAVLCIKNLNWVLTAMYTSPYLSGRLWSEQPKSEIEFASLKTLGLQSHQLWEKWEVMQQLNRHQTLVVRALVWNELGTPAFAEHCTFQGLKRPHCLIGQPVAKQLRAQKMRRFLLWLVIYYSLILQVYSQCWPWIDGCAGGCLAKPTAMQHVQWWTGALTNEQPWCPWSNMCMQSSHSSPADGLWLP